MDIDVGADAESSIIIIACRRFAPAAITVGLGSANKGAGVLAAGGTWPLSESSPSPNAGVLGGETGCSMLESPLEEGRGLVCL